MISTAKDRRGVAAAEFAVVAPVLALLTLGALDLVQLMRAQAGVETAAGQLGQTVSQCTRISTPGDTNQFWAMAQATLGGMTDVRNGTGATGAVIVTAVRNSGGVNTVAWQVRTGNTSLASKVASTKGSAALPGTLSVADGQLLIVTEVYAPVQPWALSRSLMGIGAVPEVLGSTSMYLSRTADPATVQQAPSNNTATVCMS